MKNQVLLILLTATFSVIAQNNKTIKPKPNKAIVYLSGAEISYSESLTLPAGSSEFRPDHQK
jgi:hypothetical protein